MEAAIRSALDRAENPDKAARARIYHSAFEALKRNMEKKGVSDPALLQSQGSKLKDLIVRIESEYGAPAPMSAPTVAEQATAPDVRPTTSDTVDPVDAPEVQTAPQTRATTAPEVSLGSTEGRPEPAFGFASDTQPSEKQTFDVGVLSADVVAGPSNGPDAATIDAPTAKGKPQRTSPEAAPPYLPDDGLNLPPQKKEETQKPLAERRKLRLGGSGKKSLQPKSQRGSRHVFASGFSGLVLLTFFGMGLWWMIDTGAFQSTESRDTSVPNPPPQASSEDYEGNGSSQSPLNPGAGFTDEWVTVFAPQNDEPTNTGSQTETALVRDETGNGLQIRSDESGEGGEISIPIDAAILQSLAGRRAIIALTLHSIDAEVVQFYVKCDFGTLGDCGRHRFQARYETTDSLIEVDFSRQLAPNKDGRIIINGDLSGSGKGIELLSIRARPAR